MGNNCCRLYSARRSVQRVVLVFAVILAVAGLFYFRENGLLMALFFGYLAYLNWMMGSYRFVPDFRQMFPR